MGNLPSGVQTIHHWHCEVKDDEVGDELLALLHSLATIHGLVTDLPIGIRKQIQNWAAIAPGQRSGGVIEKRTFLPADA